MSKRVRSNPKRISNLVRTIVFLMTNANLKQSKQRVVSVKDALF